MDSDWVYLSPHFDDVALSCGGLVWEQAQAGRRIQVWTICGGEPPARPYSNFAASLHSRWQTGEQAVRRRKEEDIRSCRSMEAAYRHFPLADCIYRPADESIPHYYDSEEAIFGEIHPAEEELVISLGELLRKETAAGVQVVCPLKLGGHVDHRLTRAACERSGVKVLYYADYPYVLTEGPFLEQLQRKGWERLVFPLSEAGMAAWYEAVAAHASQISTFWPDLESMRRDIRAYGDQEKGAVLWRAPLKTVRRDEPAAPAS